MMSRIASGINEMRQSQGSIPVRLIIALAMLAFAGSLGTAPSFAQQTAPAPSALTEKPIYFALDPMVIPFNDKTVPQHYLKITIVFELGDQSGIQALAAMKPRIVDNFQDYLQNLHMDDVHGSDAVDTIRGDLLTRVHTVVPSVIIKNVLIQELLTQ